MLDERLTTAEVSPRQDFPFPCVTAKSGVNDSPLPHYPLCTILCNRVIRSIGARKIIRSIGSGKVIRTTGAGEVIRHREAGKLCIMYVLLRRGRF